MCGIIGIVQNGVDVVNDVLLGLQNLEYRGYDSAGVATVSNSKICCVKCVGKINDLKNKIKRYPISGSVCIGHTRWATHGTVSEKNAHPHFTDNIAVVHNGIIENSSKLKDEVQNLGYCFNTETDTEVILLLLDYFIKNGFSPLEAVSKTAKKLEGSFALGIIFKGYDNYMIGVRQNAPLVVGTNMDETVSAIASDVSAVSKIVENFYYLKNQEIVEVKDGIVNIFDYDLSKINFELKKVASSDLSISKCGYDHYMLKEIMEQPEVICETMVHYKEIDSIVKNNNLHKYDNVTIIACGTSYYAGLVAKYWFDKFTDKRVSVYMASEYAYLGKKISDKDCLIFISQSGETADTLSCLKIAKQNNAKTIGIVNVRNSSIANEVDHCFYTFAGIEIGVASTKAFTTQLVVLLNLALSVGVLDKVISADFRQNIVASIGAIYYKLQEVFSLKNQIQEIATWLSGFNSAIYLARDFLYPIALEAALKLKEISYIHAEGYPAGELKHGPLALIDENMPVIVIANSKSNIFQKIISNIETILSRGGKVVFFSDSDIFLNNKNVISVKMPECDYIVSDLLYVVPMQMLAYYTALSKGTNVDQPRNLAKSVTVE